MDDIFILNGGIPLNGVVNASGSKNSTFPIIAASIIPDDKILLNNVPNIIDIKIAMDINKKLGVLVKYNDKDINAILLSSPYNIKYEVPVELGEKIRGGLYYLGALLAKTGFAVIPYPGGCDLGTRGFDLHIEIFKQMGVEIFEEHNRIYAKCPKKINSINIVLPFPSRGVTCNVMLLSCRSNGVIKIENANSSAEVVNLGMFLKNMGMKINGLGTKSITISRNASKLKYVKDEFQIPCDKVEVATLLIGALITRGKITVNKVKLDDLKELINIFHEMNVPVKIIGDSISVSWSSNIKGVSIISSLPPGIDADYEPLFASLLSTLDGNYEIYDDINPNRHNNYIPELKKLGACIEVVNQYKAIIKNTSNLNCCEDLISKDIRSAAAIILLALHIPGKSIVHNIIELDRGYEALEKKFVALGASIERLKME